MIELDYKKDVELFNKTAKECAKAIGGDKKNGVQNTQIRKFYDQVLDLNLKAKGMDETEFKEELLPFVKMLNSKVAYASNRSPGGRKLVNKPFVDMMNDSIKQINNKEKLNTFKLFFEAVIGFHKSLERED